jgi:hypothetical protein
VKAELEKLGDAPRVYSEKLKNDDMNMDGGYNGRLSMNDRF